MPSVARGCAGFHADSARRGSTFACRFGPLSPDFFNHLCLYIAVSLFAASSSWSHIRVPFLVLSSSSLSRNYMAEEAQRQSDLVQQLADGFAALSGEYQALSDHQKQLESKLSWAKQQVRCIISYFVLSCFVMIHLALDLKLHQRLDRQQPRLITTLFQNLKVFLSKAVLTLPVS